MRTSRESIYRNLASLYVKEKYIQELSQFALQNKSYIGTLGLTNTNTVYIKGKNIQENCVQTKGKDIPELSKFANQRKVFTRTKQDQNEWCTHQREVDTGTKPD